MSVEIVTGEAAVLNLATQPANIMLYGGPGMMKTTDAVSAFCQNGRCSAFVIPCEDGALKPILARGLPVPDHPRNTIKSWGDLQEVMAWLWQLRQSGRCPYTAVIIDTVSTLTAYLYREAEEQFKGNKNKFLVPVFLRNCLYTLREWCRQIGLHSVFVAHGMAPAVRDGVFYKGGPLLSPKSMIEDYFSLVDSVIRVEYVQIPGMNNNLPFRTYWTGGTAFPKELGPFFQPPPDWQMWRTKNREGVNDALVPADLTGFLKRRSPPYAGL